MSTKYNPTVAQLLNTGARVTLDASLQLAGVLF